MHPGSRSIVTSAAYEESLQADLRPVYTCRDLIVSTLYSDTRQDRQGVPLGSDPGTDCHPWRTIPSFVQLLRLP